MNLTLPYVPTSASKPRNRGVNMIMDKGLSVREGADMVEVCGHLVDFVKLGFGTAAFTDLRALKKKVKLYHRSGIRVYLGGTLFEACLIRGQVDQYLRFARELRLESMEVSDGSMTIEHAQKCDLIRQMRRQFGTVLSEVGSKVAGRILPATQWIRMMQQELEAGSAYVIAEAREAGNVGIFNADGSANGDLITEISRTVPLERILWEAPTKGQQAWFVKSFGAQVNLGNISHNEVIALETLRTGLRGDTFGQFLPDTLKSKVQK